MFQKALVTIKGVKDGIAVDIDEKADFYSVMENLRQKVSSGKRFFAGSNIKVYFKGRMLSKEEEDALSLIISQVAGVTISQQPTEKKRTPLQKDEKESEAVELVEEKEDKPPPAKKNYTESNCAFYSTGLRSGQSIKYGGSVVVMGDVNPGSEIVADGNVIVMGSLKGLAHAGAGGDESCFVSALVMQPVQLRIAGVISSMPKAGTKKPEVKPSCAFIKDGKVCIAAL